MNWIEVNLPWRAESSPYNMVAFPNLDARWKESFGETPEEYLARLVNPEGAEYVTESKVWKEYNTLVDEHCSGRKIEERKILDPLNNRSVQLVFAYRDLRHRHADWYEKQPEVVLVNNENIRIHKEYKEAEAKRSFSASDLCRPGILIEYQNSEGKIHQILIGHINSAGGVCGDCMEMNNTDLIKRCCIVWQTEK